MPEGFFEAVKVLLRISLEERECGRVKPPDFQKGIIERIYVGSAITALSRIWNICLSIIGGKALLPQPHVH